MEAQEISSFSFWIVAIMICVILLIIVAQISRFYASFQAGRKELDAHLIGLAAMLKKQQSTATELLIEQRRQIRLQLEALDLKRAEMTGDFDIVEEPIPAPQEAAPEPLSPSSTTKRRDSGFPTIDIDSNHK